MNNVIEFNSPAPSCLVGKVFGRLTVIERASNTVDWKKQWLCKCVCGTSKVIRQEKLRSGHTKSCGCLMKEVSKKIHQKHGHSPRQGKPSATYMSWANMIQRCTNENNHKFYAYGARGIGVCERWMSFENFLKDMGERPDKMTIDRIDVESNYTPENCRWANSYQQASNKTNTRLVEFNGRTHCLSVLARAHGMTPRLLWQRLNNGWNVEIALTRQVQKQRGKNA